MSGGNEGVDHKPAKKKYVKPAFQFEEVFETLALACDVRNKMAVVTGCSKRGRS